MTTREVNMEQGEKPGFMGRKITTIILVAVLVIILGVFIWIHFAMGGLENFFYKFKSRKRPAPQPIKPSVMNDLDDQSKLKSLDSRLALIDELSWRKSA